MTDAHAAAVLAIYQAGIEEGNATFETRAPDWAAFTAARSVTRPGCIPTVTTSPTMVRGLPSRAWMGALADQVRVRWNDRPDDRGQRLLAVEETGFRLHDIFAAPQQARLDRDRPRRHGSEEGDLQGAQRQFGRDQGAHRSAPWPLA